MSLTEEIQKRGSKAVKYLLEKSREKIKPEDPLFYAATHYLGAGGKGFRPAMMQLTCGALGGNEEMALPAAAAIEAVHVSSLIHDDFMDQDETRRGVEAVWKKWDPTTAILAGDVLFGLGFGLAGEVEGISDTMRLSFATGLSDIYVQLCHGQGLDIGFEDMHYEDISIEDVSQMQFLKTGVLFVFSCVTGAQIALNKVEDPMIDAVRDYATNAGIAFQIQDDIIGLIGDEEKTGKPVGSDIIEGKKTIIAIHALSNASAEQKEKMLLAFGNHDASNEEIQLCLETMKELGSIKYAKDRALDLANKGISAIEKLPSTTQTELLREFALYMIHREL